MSFRFVLALFLLPVFAIKAAAMDLSQCTAITDNNDRLKCYDDIAAPKETKTTQTSNWMVEVEKSPMDDSTTVYMSVESENSIPPKFRTGPDKADLLIRCKENKTVIFAVFSDYFLGSSTELSYIEYRVDSEKAERKRFYISNDHKAIGLWDGESIKFIKSLFSKNQLILRVTPFSESPVTAIFPISGIETAIDPLRKACNW